MFKTIILYLIAALLLLDCVLCTNIALQIVCSVLVLVICVLGAYIAYKQSTGIWLNTQQYEALHEFVKDAILLDANSKK